MSHNVIRQSVDLLGGISAAARVAGVTHRAVRRWIENGRLPYTDSYGKTDYAERWAEAHPDIDKQALLDTTKKEAA